MQHLMSLKDLKSEISKKEYKRKQFYMIWLALQFVQDHPENFLEIGIGWFDNDHFLFNSTIFGLFACRKINTINHYFETYGFGHQKMNADIKKKACELYSIDAISDQKSWSLRWCNGLTKSTTEIEAQNWSNLNQNKKRLYKVNKSHLPKIRTDFNFDLLNRSYDSDNWMNFSNQLDKIDFDLSCSYINVTNINDDNNNIAKIQNEETKSNEEEDSSTQDENISTNSEEQNSSTDDSIEDELISSVQQNTTFNLFNIDSTQEYNQSETDFDMLEINGDNFFKYDEIDLM